MRPKLTEELKFDYVIRFRGNILALGVDPRDDDRRGRREGGSSPTSPGELDGVPVR